tara:strand:+ start:12803 stop:13972 length:1170 start_codon:yes stop_codon:yes gene_type:complete
VEQARFQVAPFDPKPDPAWLNVDFWKGTLMRVIVTGDLLRNTGQNQMAESDQAKNVDWLKSVLDMPFAGIADIEVEVLISRNQNAVFDRLGCYSALGRDVTIEDWCEIYEGKNNEIDILVDFIGPYFENCQVIISHEAPPYLFRIAQKIGVKIIDVGVAPLRFSSDYILGLRSNDVASMSLIEKCSMRPMEFHDAVHTRVALSHSRAHPLNIENGVLFVGQMDIDASLIQGGSIPKPIDVLNALELTSAMYGRVYYKPHPNNNNTSWLRKICNEREDFIWINRNIYDTLVLDDWSRVISFSSSVVKEAPFFRKKADRMLKDNDIWPYFDGDVDNFIGTESEMPNYAYISNKTFFSSGFWAGLLQCVCQNYIECYRAGLVKRTLVEKWGF